MEGGPARLGAPFERIGGLSADRGHYSRCLPLRMRSSEGTKSPEGFQLHIVERLRQGGFHLLLLRVHQLGQSLFEPFPALQLIELAERKVGDQPSGDTRDDPPPTRLTKRPKRTRPARSTLPPTPGDKFSATLFSRVVGSTGNDHYQWVG